MDEGDYTLPAQNQALPETQEHKKPLSSVFQLYFITQAQTEAIIVFKLFVRNNKPRDLFFFSPLFHFLYWEQEPKC